MLRRRARRTTEDDQERTRRLAPGLREAGWVLPWWMTRALDPDHPAADPTPDSSRLTNDTGANWTRIGTVDSSAVTAVDPRGLVALDGWALDWWIGAEDRWHVPSQEVAVRQSLLGSSPVVETLVRVPGGDAVQRVYGIRGEKHAGGDEYVVVEVENRSKAPFAVVWAVRPFHVDGVGRIGSITVEPTEGGAGRDAAHLVRLDGRPALVLPRRPARAAASTLDHGDVAREVLSGDAPDALPEPVRCPAELASAAFVVPVPHTAVVRVVLPVGTQADDAPVAWPPVLPTADNVVSGWAVQSRRGVAIDVPDPRLTDALSASRRFLLLAADLSDLSSALTAGIVLRALDVLGLHDEVRRVLWQQAAIDVPHTLDDVTLLDVAATHWRLTRDHDTIEEVLPQLAAGLERIGRSERRGRLPDRASRDEARGAVAGLREVLAGIGQTAAAEAVDGLLGRLGPAGDDGLSEADDDPADELMHPRRELSVARAAIASGDPSGLVRLNRVLDVASATWTWPEAVHRAHGGGDGHGHDPEVGAMLVDVVRTLLVSERADGLALLSVLPTSWYGGGIQVEDAPTGWGLVSYAVRWHGDRPALLWDVRPHEGTGPVRLTCPGLDPTWSTTEPRGDALLAVVPAPVIG